MRIAITGHRPARLKGQENFIEDWIKDNLNKYDCTTAISGMAQGVDQIFARVAAEKDIPLICCYPYRKDFFHQEERKILSKAKDIKFISEVYTGNRVYWLRDKYMVDNCDLLFAVWDGVEVGGTWLTINYARKIGKPIVYYDFNKENI